MTKSTYLFVQKNERKPNQKGLKHLELTCEYVTLLVHLLHDLSPFKSIMYKPLSVI